MFATITWIVLIATPLLLALHFLVAVARRSLLVEDRRRLRAAERLLYAVLLLSIAALAVTSLYPVLRGGHMAGWLLWAHLAAAGVFTIALALVVLLWAAACRFGFAPAPAGAGGARFAFLTRLSFWALLLAALVTMATMLGGMTHHFTAEQIETLIAVHRYGGLALLAAALVHLYSLCLARIGLG